MGTVREAQTGDGLLELAPGDSVVVVEGRYVCKPKTRIVLYKQPIFSSEAFYWYGQSTRTRKFGKVARKTMVRCYTLSHRECGYPRHPCHETSRWFRRRRAVAFDRICGAIESNCPSSSKSSRNLQSFVTKVTRVSALSMGYSMLKNDDAL